MESIAAGIVLYNPDNKKRLEQSVESVLKQVKCVYVFDNSTENIQINLPSSVIYMTEHENKGIAYALNRIMEAAQLDGFDWVVTMDQDSILPENTLSSYEAHINNDPRVAIVCPQVIDSRRSYMEVKTEPAKECVDFCITSASCTNLEAWESVGKFDEWLFIDLVDNDFCKRLIVSGYTILRLNDLVLDQEFGIIKPKSKRTQQFWNNVAKTLHNDNFGKLGYSKFVSPIRVYYTCRNIIYVNKKMKKYGKTGFKENYNCNGFIGFIFNFIVPSVLRAQTKTKVIKAVIIGLYEGFKEKVPEWKARNTTQNQM